MLNTTANFPVRALTRGPLHHFFGYYDKLPWQPDGDLMLGHQNSFMDRQPTVDDEVTVGVTRPDAQTFEPLAQTRAWNWQQGAMLQWIGNQTVAFNVREDDEFRARLLKIGDGTQRTLPRPINFVSPDKSMALTCNYARLYATRPGYGYAGPHPNFAGSAPDDDGVWLMDMNSGDAKLVLSLARLAHEAAQRGFEAPPGAIHWINHMAFNPGASRILLLHRCMFDRPDGVGKSRRTFAYACDLDGEGLFRFPDAGQFSHYDWRDDAHLLAWATVEGAGQKFFLFEDKTGKFEIVADGELTADGHCSYSPDRRWILSDEYPKPTDFAPCFCGTPKRKPSTSWVASTARCPPTATFAATCTRAGTPTDGASASIRCTKATDKSTKWISTVWWVDNRVGKRRFSRDYERNDNGQVTGLGC